jgi:hypothetical protein
MVKIRQWIIWPVLVLFLAGCSGINPYTYQSAGIGGAVGAGAGALIDHHNRWRGAMIGTLGGAALGGAVSEITRRGIESSQPQTSNYYGNPTYQGQAYGNYYDLPQQY